MQHEDQIRPLNPPALGSVLGTGLGLDFSFFLAQFPAGCLWRMGMAPWDLRDSLSARYQGATAWINFAAWCSPSPSSKQAPTWFFCACDLFVFPSCTFMSLLHLGTGWGRGLKYVLAAQFLKTINILLYRNPYLTITCTSFTFLTINNFMLIVFYIQFYLHSRKNFLEDKNTTSTDIHISKVSLVHWIFFQRCTKRGCNVWGSGVAVHGDGGVGGYERL